MIHLTYLQTVYPGFRTAFIQPTRSVNRLRRRWPTNLLFFVLGLLAGWLLREGGAWLP